MMEIEKFLEIPECVPPKPLECEFNFAVIGLAHTHICLMCNGLIAAGARLKYVYDNDKTLIASFVEHFPDVQVCKSEEEILEKQDVRLVASADIPALRAPLGIRAMNAGKDFFCDKAPFISLKQLEDIKTTCKETGRKYFIYYGEHIHDESSIFADMIIKRGVIGDVSHIDGLAPHVLNAQYRPNWFFSTEITGGVLVDLASHQIEQLLHFAKSSDANIDSARVSNYFHSQFTDFEDFGDVSITCDNGITGYFRMDWNSPLLNVWGDARTFISGSRGYIELRKNLDITKSNKGNNIFVVLDGKEYYVNVTGKIGFPYFSQLIDDCLYRTETAMPQSHALKAGELAVKAQLLANSYKTQK